MVKITRPSDCEVWREAVYLKERRNIVANSYTPEVSRGPVSQYLTLESYNTCCLYVQTLFQNIYTACSYNVTQSCTVLVINTPYSYMLKCLMPFILLLFEEFNIHNHYIRGLGIKP
jgi:hypothetical protein